MVGFGRVLFHARQYWPDYISCVLVVRQDVIDQKPQAVQVLVDGIARSGLWLEDKERRRQHREHAADFVGRYYYRQDPSILRWALLNPVDRVKYEPLSPRRADFELIVRMMVETGVLDRPIPFEDFVDTRFAEGARFQTPWHYEAGDPHAE
jgi:NitT/TauT family transport system substrate-binding protein